MENLFSTRDTYSANFGTELAKSDGGSTPDFKVFVEPKSFSVDSLVDWNVGTFNNVVAGTNGTFGTNGNIQLGIGTMYGTYTSKIYDSGFHSNFKQLNMTELKTNPSWTKETNMGVLPSADGWTYNGSAPEATYASVAGGILITDSNTIGGLSQSSYYIAPAFNNATGWTVEAKIKVISYSGTQFQQQLRISIRDGVWLENLLISNLGIKLSVSGETYAFDTTDAFHVYRITGIGTVVKVYVDGILRLTGTLSFALASDYMDFGDISAINGENSKAEWNYIKYSTAGAYAPAFDNDSTYPFEPTQYQFRTGTDVSSCDVATWKAVVSGTRPAIDDGEFYQFRIALTGDGTTSPVVDKVQGTTQYSLGERLISAPEVSRSLERLFQETQISSIGINLDNADDFFNPLGTGLYAVSSVYNKTIEIWKGFKYAWNGSTWGTAEYIPAFTGYVDNIQIDGNGRAVLNARDKGKLFHIRTSEKVTTTGTAGGAYWTNIEIGLAVRKTVEQGAGLGTADYYIQSGIVKDHTFAHHLDIDYSYVNTGTTASMVVKDQKIYFSIGTNLYEWDDYISDSPKLIYQFNLPAHSACSDGTYLYYMKSNGKNPCYLSRFDGTTETLLDTFGANSAGTAALRTNVVFAGTGIYYAIQQFGTTSGTAHGIFSYNSITQTHEWMFHVNNGIYTGGRVVGSDGRYLHGFGIGTSTYRHVVYDTTIGTIIGTYLETGVAINETGAVSGGCSVSGTNIYSFAPVLRDVEFEKTIELRTSADYGGTAITVFENGTVSGTIDTTGTSFSNTIHAIYVPPNNVLNFRSSRYYAILGTSQYSIVTYSDEYQGHIGTFETGNADYVADVLQNLAKDTNYVQFIDEAGKFNFVNRDSGTVIRHSFDADDIITVGCVKGDNVSSAEIINHIVWGTATGTVSYDDLPSQGTYGVQSFQYQSKYVSNGTLANDIIYGMIRAFAYPKAVISAKLRYYPVVKLFDVCGLDYSRLNLSGTKPWQVIAISESSTSTTLTVKEV